MGGYFALLLNVAAILVMIFCLVTVVLLRKTVPGGMVGRQWRTLSMLVLVFTIGYFVIPFFTRLPPELINLIVAVIFFLGAVYVLITIRLIYRIIEELTG